MPDESSLGWKSDAHKNLPGFRELYNRYPKADWYIMLDDDTYLLKSNLVQLLESYDPSLPHYIGSATVFVGCDGVREFNQGPNFAHGGSGIVISRGAMKIMLARLDECIIKYKPCWAGDIRTALCLRDAGILLKDPKGFNKDPPNEKYSFGDDPCHRPITFHHLLVKQIQGLADMEAQVEKRWDGKGHMEVTMEDVFRHSRKGLDPVQVNTDRTGWDITSKPTNTHQACLSECQNVTNCRSFVYDGHKCWLKSGVPSVTTATGFVSGIVPEHYVCLKKSV